MNPDSMRFLDAVANDVAIAAAEAGDDVAHEHLVDQAMASAELALAEAEWLAAVHALDLIAIEEGGEPERTPDDAKDEQEILQGLRDNEPLMEAFRRHLDLLPTDTQSDVRRALELAIVLPPSPDLTRSILQRNARRSTPKIQKVLEEFFQPILAEVALLELRFASAKPWEIPALMNEHAQLRNKLTEAETQLAVDSLTAETGQGDLIRTHSFLQSLRTRIEERNSEE